MSSSNNQYIKFMSDIIDSGLWGKLSPAGRTLYPVLLKFSDQNFKQVWPSTDTLLKLTGFKTKKSILLGKKELIKEGLLQYKPGSGRTNSTYFFAFNYEGSRITPLWDNQIPPSVLKRDTPADPLSNSHESNPVSLNHLNITINNTQSNKPDIEKYDYEKLIDLYGIKIVDSAFSIAKSKGLENNIPYVTGICKDISKSSNRKMPNFNQGIDTAQHVIDSWRNFINWSKTHLTRSSIDILEKMAIEVDGQTIFIKEPINQFLKQIVLKYFNEEVSPSILIVFAENTSKSYHNSSFT